MQYASVLFPTLEQLVKALKDPLTSNSTNTIAPTRNATLTTSTPLTATTPQSQPSVIPLRPFDHIARYCKSL